jgi:hypothetical protein
VLVNGTRIPNGALGSNGDPALAMAPPPCQAARDVSTTTAERVLPACEWSARAAAHRARAERWTVPARDRRAAGKPHPVDDFLFTYYRFSYAKIEEWHPPVGTALELTDLLPAHLSKEPYRIEDGRVIADPSLLGEKERARLRWMRELLVATRDRPPVFSCHGLHEWAMVYRGDEVRHAGTAPLRLPQAEVDALVESRPVRCSHFDAFRFFHPDARPLNRLQPTLHGRPDFEQPGCIHVNMDLYKWAFKAMPWPGSDLLLDCFELAMELRDLDMRASPYDLSEHGFEPVRIETAEGRREYESEQARLAEKAVPLRWRLIEGLGEVLGV